MPICPGKPRSATVMRCLRDLPAVADAYADGLVGTDQVRRIAAVWAIPRVTALMVAAESTFLDAAQQMEYTDFDSFCAQWVGLVDVDGAHHESRTTLAPTVRLAHAGLQRILAPRRPPHVV
ncbi:MAG: hypothetical protein R2695_16645 [Acidimicrobiales bacterium]